MNFDALPIKITSHRDAGRLTQYSFQLLPGDVREQLRALIAALPLHGEISVPAPGPGDFYLGARRAISGLEVKRGGHGAAGSWKSVTQSDALEWLVPGASCAETQRSGWQLELPA